MKHGGGSYADWIKKELSLSKEELVEKWTNDYLDHIERVSTFFRDKPNFLFFDITKHGEKELKDFFAKNGVKTYYAKWSKNFSSNTELFKEHLYCADDDKIAELSANARAIESTHPAVAINLLEVVCNLRPDDEEAVHRLKKLRKKN